ncbi:DUF2163 domain-containing protein [Roseibium sediminis]|uniref:DUF2163 domain-containing protein n=1 Tax=Roseibium sediminis TaxID=1775174 RepID=UPI00123E2F54|nr:DUF2163 domain-containing protein [Roseibium sediminis]
MRQFETGFAGHIAGPATSLCWCWQVTRQDGLIFGFTDHDRALIFDGVTFEAASGFSGTEIESSLGLSVDNMDVEGALSSDAITESDIASGLYDDAAITLYRVNWQNVHERAVIKRGNIGEVTRGAIAFQAEFRGLAHKLQQTIGRTFQYGCDAALGDARCGVNLNAPDNKGTGTVATASGRTFQADGLSAFPHDRFSRGVLTWETGGNAGQKIKVKVHKSQGGTVELTLWREPVNPITPGDAFTVRAGCPHTFGACKVKFNNGANFRGFPHMPGNDFVMGYARQGEQENDGSPTAKLSIFDNDIWSKQ